MVTIALDFLSHLLFINHASSYGNMLFLLAYNDNRIFLKLNLLFIYNVPADRDPVQYESCHIANRSE